MDRKSIKVFNGVTTQSIRKKDIDEHHYFIITDNRNNRGANKLKVSWKFGVAKMHHKKLQKKNYDYEYQ